MIYYLLKERKEESSFLFLNLFFILLYINNKHECEIIQNLNLIKLNFFFFSIIVVVVEQVKNIMRVFVQCNLI